MMKYVLDQPIRELSMVEITLVSGGDGPGGWNSGPGAGSGGPTPGIVDPE